MHVIDKKTWVRTPWYDFFKDFDDPNFSFTGLLDVTKAKEFCKKNGVSLFLFYLHAAARSTNAIENFRYRIVNGEPVVFDTVHVGSTVLRDDKTFCFSNIDYHPDFSEFARGAQEEMARVKAMTGLITGPMRPDEVHYSAMPWVHYTATQHARSNSKDSGIPKIGFGKIHEINGRWMMPFSVQAHHGFADGYHVGLMFDYVQKCLTFEI